MSILSKKQPNYLYLFFLLIVAIGIFLLWGGLSSVFLAVIGYAVEDKESLRFLGNLSFGIMTVLILAWVHFVEKKPLSTIGIKQANLFKHYLRGFALGLLIYGLCLLAMSFIGGLCFQAVHSSPVLVWSLLPQLFMWMIQSNAEELYIRGWLFTSLKQQCSIKIAMLISSSYFMIPHLGNGQISFYPCLQYFIFALMMTFLFMKNGEIWSASGYHAAWNFLETTVIAIGVSKKEAQSSILVFHQQGPSWLSGGVDGLSGSLISTLVQVAFLVFLIYGYRVKKVNLSEN